MPNTDVITEISEAEAAFILRGLSDHVSTNGVNAFDWVLRCWQERPLFGLPALLQYLITESGPEARWNLDAHDPFATESATQAQLRRRDIKDAYVVDIIEKLLLESRVAIALAASQAVAPMPKTDGQTPPPHTDEYRTRWMVAAGLPPCDAAHPYDTEPEQRMLAEAYCKLNQIRGKPMGADRAMRQYRAVGLQPRIPVKLWLRQYGRGGRLPRDRSPMWVTTVTNIGDLDAEN